MSNQLFSTRIKALREKNNLTMDELANQLEINKSRISMWENNGTIPRMNILIKLAKFFNVSTDFLLGNDDDSNISFENDRLSYLQRNLRKLSEPDLIKAEGMLKAVFLDIFEKDNEEDDYI